MCIFAVHYVLELLKKDLFVIMKGYMCNYDFMQGPFWNIAFVEGVFAKFQCI